MANNSFFNNNSSKNSRKQNIKSILSNNSNKNKYGNNNLNNKKYNDKKLFYGIIILIFIILLIGLLFLFGFRIKKCSKNITKVNNNKLINNQSIIVNKIKNNKIENNKKNVVEAYENHYAPLETSLSHSYTPPEREDINIPPSISYNNNKKVVYPEDESLEYRMSHPELYRYRNPFQFKERIREYYKDIKNLY